MKKVLLLIESEAFSQSICQDLQKDCIPFLCHNAEDAVKVMDQKPDALVLDIGLPGMDGVSFLENLLWRPPVIITIALNYTAYSAQKLRDLGVGYFLRTPCAFRAVTTRLRDMMAQRKFPGIDDQSIVASHLEKLGIPADARGGKQLRVAIPLYAQNPEQKMSGELYPAIAKICGTTPMGSERMIRRTIGEAWSHRDPDCWSEYFPGNLRQPSNKMFISTLAEKLY